MAEITTLETKYLSLLNSISSLTAAEGGTIIAASDPAIVLDFASLSPPFAVLVFNGENASATNIIDDGAGALQQSDMQWSIFVGSASFSTSGDRTGVYQLIDDVLAAVQGQILSLDPPSKPFYVRSRRYSVAPNFVVYEIVFRNSFIRSND